MHMRLKEKSFQRNCLKTAKSSSWLSFTLPFGLAERYEWWMMTLLSNNTLVCFWSLLWVHASSSKHELPLTFVTMEEGEKKKRNQYVPPNSSPAQVLEGLQPPTKTFLLHIYNNNVSNIQIPYIWLVICMEYCMWLSTAWKLLCQTTQWSSTVCTSAL